jgi:hypothetical protein
MQIVLDARFLVPSWSTIDNRSHQHCRKYRSEILRSLHEWQNLCWIFVFGLVRVDMWSAGIPTDFPSSQWGCLSTLWALNCQRLQLQVVNEKCFFPITIKYTGQCVEVTWVPTGRDLTCVCVCWSCNQHRSHPQVYLTPSGRPIHPRILQADQYLSLLSRHYVPERGKQVVISRMCSSHWAGAHPICSFHCSSEIDWTH